MKIRATATAAALVVAGIGLSSPVIATADAVDDLITADYESAQWALTAVRASDAWNTATGDGVVVAVLDTGADANHPDLDAQLVDGSYTYLTWDEETGEPIAVTDPVSASDSYDYYGHGTHVSGIIAAERNGVGVTGLAYDAQIMPVQLNLDDVWSTADFAEVLDDAIRYAADNGADVINMSLGTSAMDNWDWETDPDLIAENEAYYAAEQKICDAISYAALNDVIVVSASGNSYAEGNPLSIPAYCEDGLSVGSVNPNFTVPSSFSSQDESLDIVAPGETVFSTFPTEISGEQTEFADFPYMEMSGTSMASPMVAAAAALWLENYSGSDPAADFREDLIGSAKDLMSISGFDPYTGFGLLDAYALVDDSASSHNFATVPYLRLVGAGPSYNASNGFAVAWDAPLASVLPNDYTLEIFQDGDDTAVYSQSIAGTAIRTSFPAVETDYTSYLVLTANYDASSVSTPPILYSLGGGGSSEVELDPVMGVTAKANATSVSLTWDDYFDPEADAIVVTVGGAGVYAEEWFYPSDGEFPTRVTVELFGADPGNGDMFIDVYAMDEDSWSSSPWSSLALMAKAPAVINYYEMIAPDVLRATATPNLSSGCEYEMIDDELGLMSCAGMAVQYSVKLHYESAAGSKRVFPASNTIGYVSYWGDVQLNAINVPPRKGLTATFVELIPLNAKGKSIPGANRVLMPMYGMIG